MRELRIFWAGGSMQDDTLPLNNSNATTTPLSTRLPFTKYDFGWVLLCIGMAIGAGTVLMPVQIGLKGIWVFITAFIIAYPATYIVQDIYLKTLSESETCDDYTDIGGAIKHHRQGVNKHPVDNHKKIDYTEKNAPVFAKIVTDNIRIIVTGFAFR